MKELPVSDARYTSVLQGIVNIATEVGIEVFNLIIKAP